MTEAEREREAALAIDCPECGAEETDECAGGTMHAARIDRACELNWEQHNLNHDIDPKRYAE